MKDLTSIGISMIIFAFLLLMIVASATHSPGNTRVSDRYKNVEGVFQDFRLKDNTRCVTWHTGYAGGLSCDFQNKNGDKS